MGQTTNLLEYIEVTWNYRIMRRKCKETGEMYYSLNEVFYEDNKPTIYSDTNEVIGNTKDEIISVLEVMLADAKKDQTILTETDFNNDR